MNVEPVWPGEKKHSPACPEMGGCVIGDKGSSWRARRIQQYRDGKAYLDRSRSGWCSPHGRYREATPTNNLSNGMMKMPKHLRSSERTRVAIASCVMLVSACLFAQAPAPRPRNIEGFDAAKVRFALGAPRSIVPYDQGSSEWEYDTPLGVATISFKDGKAVLKPELSPHVHPPLPDDLEELYRRGVANSNAGNLHDARLDLAKCVAMNPQHRRCAKLHGDVIERYATVLNAQYKASGDLKSRRIILGQMLEVEPSSARVLAEVERVDNELVQKSRAALNSLAEALDAIDAANGQLRQAEYATAAATLAPFANFEPAARVMTMLSTRAADATRAEVRKANTIEDVDRLALRIATNPALTNTVIDELLSSLTNRLASLLGEEAQRLTSPARSRLFLEGLRSQFPNASGLAIDWSSANIPEPLIMISLSVEPAEDCGDALAKDSVVRAIAAAFGSGVRVSNSSLFKVRVTVDCSSDMVAGAKSSITSTYVSSYQQILNPDYVRAQQALAEAQKALADYESSAARTSSSTLGAIVAGIGEGVALNAVTKATNQLRNTPPYLSEPIKSPYSVTKYSVARVARLSAEILTQAVAAGHEERSYVARARDSSDNVIEGVLRGDSEGLSNHTAALRSVDLLWVDAMTDAIAEVARSIQTELANALIEQARREQDAPTAVGLVLLSRDLAAGEANAVVLDDRKLDEIRHMPFAQVQTLALNDVSLQFPPKVVSRQESTRQDQQARTPRGAAIQKALDAVVTVQTPASSGTGFFISTNGLVVTNAHVIRGAAKIIVHCRDGSRFLAAVVKVVDSPDLALLKIVGPVPAILIFGDSDQVEVGSEVIAIGTPRGLEGTVTRGIVSASRIIDGIHFFQVDAAVNPGNSGGPLVDAAGSVIAVTTLKQTESEGLGFGIAASEVKKVFGAYLN